MYKHVDDTMRFLVAGAEKVQFNSSGNVGIGTTNPTARITLADHTTAAGGIKFRSAASTVSLFSNGSGNLMCAADFNSAGRIRVVGGNAAADPDFDHAEPRCPIWIGPERKPCQR